EVAIEGADADSGAAADLLQGRVRALLGEDLARRRHQLVVVAARVGTLRPLGESGRRGSGDVRGRGHVLTTGGPPTYPEDGSILTVVPFAISPVHLATPWCGQSHAGAIVPVIGGSITPAQGRWRCLWWICPPARR